MFKAALKKLQERLTAWMEKCRELLGGSRLFHTKTQTDYTDSRVKSVLESTSDYFTLP